MIKMATKEQITNNNPTTLHGAVEEASFPEFTKSVLGLSDWTLSFQTLWTLRF